MSLWGTNQFWVASLDLILFLDILKLFVQLSLAISCAGVKINIFGNYKGFQKLLDEDYVTFCPFSGVPKHCGEFRMTTLSYQALVWTPYKLQENCELQENYELHRAWCLYAMDYAEQAYIDDLIAMGYIPVPNTNGSIEEHIAADDSIKEQQEQLKKEMEQLKNHLRDNLTLYVNVTKLKATSSRNDIAHVFPNSFKQTIYKPTHAPIERRKNRSLHHGNGTVSILGKLPYIKNRQRMN